MTQKPTDHDHGESKGRLKEFTDIERESADDVAQQAMGKKRGYDEKSRRAAEFLRIDRGHKE